MGVSRTGSVSWTGWPPGSLTASPGVAGESLRLELLADPGAGGTGRGGVPRRPRGGGTGSRKSARTAVRKAGRAGVMTRFVSPGASRPPRRPWTACSGTGSRTWAASAGAPAPGWATTSLTRRCTPGWPSWAPTRPGWRRCHRATAPAPCTVTGDHAELRVPALGVRCGRAYVLLGKRSRAGQDPGTWSRFGGAITEGE